MKKSMLSKLLFLIFLIVFINVINVYAALPSTITSVSQVGSSVRDNCSNDSCYAMPLKVANVNGNNVAVICTDYYSSVPTGQSCTKTSGWDDKVRYGVAAIIKQASSNINASSLTNQYFAAEMAINRFLFEKKCGWC